MKSRNKRWLPLSSGEVSMMKATASGQRALTMQLLSTVLYCLLLTALTTALKSCDDCVKAVDCKPALDLLLSDRSPEAYKQLRDAACDVKGSHKVCCSSILGVRFSTDEIENNAQTSGDEIENHRNIRLLSSECGDLDGNRIIGGTTAGLYEFPWMALISYNEGGNLKFKCGGSVITSKYVMTAGHCINKSIVGVRIGDYDISQPEDCVGEEELRECESKYQDITVTHRIRHPKYVTESVGVALHDIGLLRLATPVDFSYRNSGSVCLPITKVLRENALPDDHGTVAGWGATETQQQSNVLLKVQVTIYSELTCKSLYIDAFRSRPYNSNTLMNTICAGETGRDSCKGDSGGPLMVEAPYNGTYKFVQIGIISFGLEGCGTNKPGLYTDVRKYMKWILDTIKP